MKGDVLVSITAARENGEIVYSVDCSSELTEEEFEFYLEELISGICKWKPDICKGVVKKFRSKMDKQLTEASKDTRLGRVTVSTVEGEQEKQDS